MGKRVLWKAGTALAAMITGAGTALAEVPKVAADITPVHGLVSRVMQGVGEPTLIVQPGASPHGYSMRPSEARALDQADVVFWLGHPLTPWLEGPLEELAADAHRIELLVAKGTTVLPFREGARFEAHDHDDEAEGGHSEHDDHDHDTHDEHDSHEAHDTHDDHGEHEAKHDHDSGESHEGHDHDGEDPHAWLLPANAQVWLDVIAEELAEHDPANATLYRENAAAGKQEIADVADKITAQLTPFQSRRFIVFHDAYQYFERGFGLNAAGAISLSDATKPSPSRIAEVREVVADLSVTCVFSEPQFNPGLVATVLDGTGAGTAILDPLGADIEAGPEFYPTLLQRLGTAIAGCE